ncbi:MAG: hypothetical protein R2706_14835 [Acidimicrobiales bacterium]
MTSPVFSRPSGLDQNTDPGAVAGSVERRVSRLPVQGTASYDHFVGAAVKASVTIFASQIVASLVVANLSGARLTVAKWRLIPYLAIVADEATFVSTVTWSTLAAVIAACFMALWVQHTRSDEHAVVYGWATGILMAGLLVLFQVLRGWLGPPAVQGWILAQAAAVVAASTVLFIGLQPRGRVSLNAVSTAEDEVSEEPVSPPNPSNGPLGSLGNRSNDEA